MEAEAEEVNSAQEEDEEDQVVTMGMVVMARREKSGIPMMQDEVMGMEWCLMVDIPARKGREVEVRDGGTEAGAGIGGTEMIGRIETTGGIVKVAMTGTEIDIDIGMITAIGREIGIGTTGIETEKGTSYSEASIVKAYARRLHYTFVQSTDTGIRTGVTIVYSIPRDHPGR